MKEQQEAEKAASAKTDTDETADDGQAPAAESSDMNDNGDI